MRVAYIAPYQGPALLRKRPIVRNLSLAGNVKVEVVSELLHRTGHEVEILSQGEVVEPRLALYRAYREPEPFHPDITVSYASALPIKFVNGFWSSWQTLDLFKKKHAERPFDVVIIYNLKQPQVLCATHAMSRLGLPVVVEYEDDAFVDLGGRAEQGFRSRLHLRSAKKVLDSASACLGVSPLLLSRMPDDIPKMLLRGVVDEAILKAADTPMASRKNWVVYSGTHYRGKGLEELIKAWKMAAPKDWELHIAGRGELTGVLEAMAAGDRRIVFHGLLNRQENARFLSSAKIGMNPHGLSQTPGNVFAFKIIEYLAAGVHCITTPMGALEPELEKGITYMADNSPETIAKTLTEVIASRGFERLAAQSAQDIYGPEAIARSLDRLLKEVMKNTDARRVPPLRVPRNGSIQVAPEGK